MEKIVDVVFTKRSVFRTNDPYSLALAIKEIASQYGIVKERVHEYDTNGPRKMIKLYFDLSNRITRHMLTKLAFIMNGEVGVVTSFLEVKVVGKSVTRTIQAKGLASQVYDEFYLKSIFSLFRKESEARLREISSAVEHEIKGMLYKYA